MNSAEILIQALRFTQDKAQYDKEGGLFWLTMAQVENSGTINDILLYSSLIIHH